MLKERKLREPSIITPEEAKRLLELPASDGRSMAYRLAIIEDLLYEPEEETDES
jgi:hypothetical protein